MQVGCRIGRPAMGREMLGGEGRPASSPSQGSISDLNDCLQISRTKDTMFVHVVNRGQRLSKPFNLEIRYISGCSIALHSENIFGTEPCCLHAKCDLKRVARHVMPH